MGDAALLGLFGLVLFAVLLLLLRRSRRHRATGPARSGGTRRTLPRAKRPLAVIDGSNIMHWQDNAPGFAPISQVVHLLERHGYRTGVIFDANAGYKLAGRFLNDAEFGRHLGIGKDNVMVVPKGTQADPYLLRYATETKAIVVSNDRFRDWLADYPDLASPGRIVRGGMREGQVWLDLPKG
ncbi:hypothetical protein MASR1M32_41030 [Rhodobacter sp.]